MRWRIPVRLDKQKYLTHLLKKIISPIKIILANFQFTKYKKKSITTLNINLKSFKNNFISITNKYIFCFLNIIFNILNI